MSTLAVHRKESFKLKVHPEKNLRRISSGRSNTSRCVRERSARVRSHERLREVLAGGRQNVQVFGQTAIVTIPKALDLQFRLRQYTLYWFSVKWRLELSAIVRSNRMELPGDNAVLSSGRSFENNPRT